MKLETFSQILFWVFVATNAIFCVLFLWKTIVGYRATARKKTVVMKAVVGFVSWLAATFVIIAIMTAYFAGHSPIPDEARQVYLESATVYLISFIIGWILVGAAIVFWMSRVPQNKNYGSN